MTAGIELLDKYVAFCKHASDSATARALKVRPSAVNNWRHGRSHPDILCVQKMCETLSEPMEKWIPLIEADRATTPGNKQVWLQLAQKFAAATAAASLCLAVYTSTQNSPGSDAFSQNSPGVYIM